MNNRLIHIAGVEKRYPLGERFVHVLKGVELSVERGEYLAIMGASGSGKSTLLNIIGMLDVPDNGSYHFNDQNVARLPDAQLAGFRNRHIGFVFQSFQLLNEFDVRGNIELPMMYRGVPRRDRRQRALQLAEQVGLGSRAHHRPMQLSGGEMQRTALARALANDPDLLLADEPTGNLDERTGLEIMNLFDELSAKGRTIIVVTHHPGYRQRAGRVLWMRDGRFETMAPSALNPAANSDAGHNIDIHEHDSNKQSHDQACEPHGDAIVKGGA